MNKKKYYLRFLCLYVFFILLLSLSGCQHNQEDKYYPVSDAKIRDIDTLELTEAPKEAKQEVNEPAPAKMEVILEECRALTLENNLDLKVQLINPAIAEESVNQQRAKFEAVFNANASFSKSDTPTSSTLTGSQGENSNIDLGVQLPLSTGGTVNFDFADSYGKTNNIFSTLNPYYSSNSSISISQPLLRNAGKNVSTYSIKIAETNKQIADSASKLEVIRVIAGVDRAYWRLYAARKELEVRKQQYDLAVALLEQAERFVEAGEKAQIEVIRTQAGAAQRLEAIIISENNVRDRERELKRTINKSNIQMSSQTILIPATEPDPVRYELNRSKMVEIAMDQRMEMLELELRIAQDTLSVENMKNQMLPLVTMDYRYNINGLGGARDDSYDLLLDKRFEDHRLGLQLMVPLGNKAAESQWLQAVYQKRQRLASRDSRASTIEYEVLNAADQVEANWQRILASRQSAILEGRLYETERRQFELGLVTSTDVLQTQANFANAQSAEISALVDYQISLVDLAYATGTIFGSAKIRWEPIDIEVDTN